MGCAVSVTTAPVLVRVRAPRPFGLFSQTKTKEFIMNITLSNVAIREHNGLYSINDLHRASGGEKRHQPSDWLRLKQTIELIKEAEKTGNPVILSKQGVGTFACKELICAYATWISPKFFLQVIRTFLAVHEQGSLKPNFHLTAQTTPDERKPLRDAVFALAAQYGLAYSTAYKMVHQRFNVEAIEAIPAEQIPLAVEYVHRLTLNGEVLDKQPEITFSQRELRELATVAYYCACLIWAMPRLQRCARCRWKAVCFCAAHTKPCCGRCPRLRVRLSAMICSAV